MEAGLRLFLAIEPGQANAGARQNVRHVLARATAMIKSTMITPTTSIQFRSIDFLPK